MPAWRSDCGAQGNARGMDGSPFDSQLLEERRRRLAAERTLEYTRKELARAHSALVANADRLSRSYLSEREQKLALSERQKAVLAQRKEAADRADRARRRLWHALEAMRDGFALFDAQRRLIAANHVYLDLFDAASEIAPGAHATELFELAAEEGAFDIGELTPAEWAEAQVARWDADGIEPLELHHYDGRILRILDRRAPDGDVVSLALDVTEDSERHASLAAARDAAEQTAKVKADFLARMSHEIRTPMNGVLGMAQMLAERAEDPEAALYARTIRDSAEALLVIVNDTLDVSRLEAGRVELRHEPFDLEALLCDCLRLASAAGRREVATGLLYPIGAQNLFRGDAGRVRQVAMNLIGNALKFTERGHVLVRVEVEEGLAPPFVTIAVEDTGPGVPEDRHEAVFEAFGQVDDPRRPAKEGTGLGLTISRGLADRMGGTLRLSSRPGGGTTLTLALPLEASGPDPDLPDLPDRVAVPAGSGLVGDVIAGLLSPLGVGVARTVTARERLVLLPLGLDAAMQEALLGALAPEARLVALGDRGDAAPAAIARADAIVAMPATRAALVAAMTPAPAGAIPKPAPAPDLPRILVADDNATNRLLLDRMLRDAPFEIAIVPDGADAVEAYRTRRPDAVVLDISMPGMDGFDAAAAIRAIEAERGGAPAPLLALTAHHGEEMAERLRDAGFRAHLTKPVRKEALLAALDAALSGAQARRT